MTSDQNKAIALIIPLIVKNNAGKVALALRDAGYSKNYIPAPDLEARLFQLYTANPDMFFQVIKTIPWNYGEVETNRPEIREELIRLVSQNAGYEVSKENWWTELITLLDTTEVSERTGNPIQAAMSSPKGISYGVIFLLILAALGLIIALYILFS